MMRQFIGLSALVGLVGTIGFVESNLVVASLSAVAMLPYIVMKANQPLEEEEM